MRGYVVNRYAHPKDLALSLHVPEPTPGPGQVLVDVYSAALNFFDVIVLVMFRSDLMLIALADLTISREVSNTTPLSFCSRHGAGWKDRGQFSNSGRMSFQVWPKGLW